MVQVCCPVCGAPLEMGGAAWRCSAGHSFDVARQGYVNLLTVDRKRTRDPGDSPTQVNARRTFLDAGFYAPLAEAVCAATAAASPESVLDAGCGEGYYLRCLGRRLPEAARWGVDIAKQAVRYAAARDPAGRYVTATAAHLPFAVGSFGCVWSLFALTAAAEFRRVLRRGGVFLQVTAGPDHLLGLRRLIYDRVRPKAPAPPPALPGFRLVRSDVVEFPLHLACGGQVMALLAMTPHFMRISPEGAARARAAEGLEDRAQAVLRVYEAAEID